MGKGLVQGGESCDPKICKSQEFRQKGILFCRVLNRAPKDHLWGSGIQSGVIIRQQIRNCFTLSPSYSQEGLYAGLSEGQVSGI